MTRKQVATKGQALAEFALNLPILLLLMLGMIDFGRYALVYVQSSNALRTAVRETHLFGTNFTYLNCAEIKDMANNVFFAKDVAITIEYIATNPATPEQRYPCETVSEQMLHRGDLLRVNQVVTLEPLFFPLGDLTLEFYGQRTILTEQP